VVSSLTPCVYPLIPITTALIGARKATSKLQAFRICAIYVLGMACTYTALGIVSAHSGTLFGSFTQNVAVLGVFSALLILFALSMLDALQIRALSTVQSFAQGIGGTGTRGIFLMGAASGLVAAPCVGPILVLILGIAASTHDWVLGASLLMAYSLGLGTLLVFVGTFSGLFAHLPRSGGWLNWVKFFLATALLTAALLIMAAWIPDYHLNLSVTSSLVATSIAVAVVGYRKHSAPARIVAATLLAGCFFRILHPSAPPNAVAQEPAATINWLTTLDAGTESARKSGQPILVDLYADWCAACHELDVQTFTAPSVKNILARDWVTVRINMTEETEYTQQITKQFSIAGLPTVLILNPDGTEMPQTRITEFLPPEQFLERIGVQRVAHSLASH
jgi:thiol:disulfide interchange protein DsbD